jgi:hypothetical protein
VQSRSGFTYVPFVATDEQYGASRLSALGKPDKLNWYSISIPFRLFDDDPTNDSNESKTTKTDPNEKIFNSLTPAEQSAYSLALFGTSDVTAGGAGGGCTAEVSIRLWGDRSGHPALLDAVADSVTASALASQEFLAVKKEWSTCMSGEGIQAPDRTSLVKQLRDRYAQLYNAVALASQLTVEARDLMEMERVAAEADLRCDKETSYTDTWFAALVEAQRVYLDNHPELVLQLDEIRVR